MSNTKYTKFSTLLILYNIELSKNLLANNRPQKTVVYTYSCHE